MGNTFCCSSGCGSKRQGRGKLITFEERLSKIERCDLVDFSYEGVVSIAKVVSIYDGDTCRLAFPYPNKYPNGEPEIIMKSCRLACIDTPEIRTCNSLEKEKGLEAKEYLRSLILGGNGTGLVFVKFGKDDKYGRPLITLYRKEEDFETYGFQASINQMMLNSSHAKPYDGKTKPIWNF